MKKKDWLITILLILVTASIITSTIINMVNTKKLVHALQEHNEHHYVQDE
jgi:hypothetical protein